MKNFVARTLIVIALMIGSVAVYADTVSFRGQLEIVQEDNGNAVYSGVPVGKFFFGLMNDENFKGSITDGPTRTNFGCCIAAGGLSVDNDEVLDADTATLLNALSGTSFVAGDLIDSINIEGDAATAGGGRIEIGLSYILDPAAFDDNSLDNYPHNPDDVLIALFFIAEEDDQGEDIYSALGELDSGVLPKISALGDVNGNNTTDVGVLLRNPDTGKIKLHIKDGCSGDIDNITSVSFGSKPVRGATTVPDFTGDQIPEFAVLLEGSRLIARVKDVVNGTLLGEPKFNPDFKPFAFFSVGDAGGGIGPDVVVVGREASTGKVQARVKDVASGELVSKISFSKNYVPIDAVALENVRDSAAMEIAALGINANGEVRAEVKDALTGNLIRRIHFDKEFNPLFFIAVPNFSGQLKHLAVLGRNAAGHSYAEIRRVGNGSLVDNVFLFDHRFDPRAFFITQRGSNTRGRIAAIGVKINRLRIIYKGTDILGCCSETRLFRKTAPPLDAITVKGVAGAPDQIAVLGQKESGKYRLQVSLCSGRDDIIILVP